MEYGPPTHSLDCIELSVEMGYFVAYLQGHIYLWNSVIYKIQSTLVISKSKERSKTLRDSRTSTYQICRIEENTN